MRNQEFAMKYDFVTVPDRAGHDALAIDMLGKPGGFAPPKPKDESFSVLPMWVADMNFCVAPSVIRAVQERAAHPSFGYFTPRKEYYDAIISWQKKRNGADIKEENIGYENGVLGCLSSALSAFTNPGDPILVHSPTYIGFLHTLEDTERKVICSPLFRDSDGIWRIDYDDMERKIVENRIRFSIFCSPHNPVGRVWEREEIERVMDIYQKYDILVFSDEIWSDLLLDGRKFIPTHSVSEDAKMRTVTAYAPSKTFNLAGMIESYHVIFNPELKQKMEKAGDRTHYNSMNVLSQYALIGAYGTEGAEWADELCSVLSDNVSYAYQHITSCYPGVSLARPQGTYMLFPDFSEYLTGHGMTLDELLQAGWDCGVIWQDGRPFGGEASIRINLALPTHLVQEAFRRLDKYVFHI